MLTDVLEIHFIAVTKFKQLAEKDINKRVQPHTFGCPLKFTMPLLNINVQMNY